MKDKADIRRCYRARFNDVKASVAALNETMQRDPDKLDGVEIGDLRDEVEQITQSFHEFNAYWNVYHTGTLP